MFPSSKQKMLRSVVTKKCRKVSHHEASTVHLPRAGSAPQPTFPRNGQGCQARGQIDVILTASCFVFLMRKALSLCRDLFLSGFCTSPTAATCHAARPFDGSNACEAQPHSILRVSRSYASSPLLLQCAPPPPRVRNKYQAFPEATAQARHAEKNYPGIV